MRRIHMQADKEGKAAAFAEAYHSSALRIANEEAVNVQSKMPDGQQNPSLGGSKRATTVGSIAGFFTILKVLISLSLLCSSAIGLRNF